MHCCTSHNRACSRCLHSYSVDLCSERTMTSKIYGQFSRDMDLRAPNICPNIVFCSDTSMLYGVSPCRLGLYSNWLFFGLRKRTSTMACHIFVSTIMGQFISFYLKIYCRLLSISLSLRYVKQYRRLYRRLSLGLSYQVRVGQFPGFDFEQISAMVYPLPS